MGFVLSIALIPAAWWLGGVALAWLVALLRPDTLRTGVCKHCAYDRRDVQGYLPCPECGLSIGEARRRIPRPPRPRQCVAASATTLVFPLMLLVLWLTPRATGLLGAAAGIAGISLVVLLFLVCLVLPFGWAQYAEWRFLSRLSDEIGWSFVVGPACGLVIGVAGGVTTILLSNDPASMLFSAIGWWAYQLVMDSGLYMVVVMWGVYGAILGVGLGPFGMTVWVLGAMYLRAASGDEDVSARPMRMLH